MHHLLPYRQEWVVQCINREPNIFLFKNNDNCYSVPVSAICLTEAKYKGNLLHGYTQKRSHSWHTDTEGGELSRNGASLEHTVNPYSPKE